MAALAGCHRTPPGPSLTEVPFASLPGWTEDRQADALPGLLADCTHLAAMPPAAPLGLPGQTLPGFHAGDWRGVCARAATVPKEFEPEKMSLSMGPSHPSTHGVLRIQFERQATRPFPSVREYAHLYTMDSQRLARTKPDALIMHPGPINRGVEIDSDIADCGRSLILDQVTNGLAVRMAVLFLVNGGNVPPEAASYT